MRSAAGGPGAGGENRPPPIHRRNVSDLEQWIVVVRHQISHYLRTYRFIGLLAFVLLVSVLTLAFQIDTPAPLVRLEQLNRASEYLSNFLVYIPLWIVLAAAFFGGDALSVDFASATGYYMLVLPIRRRTLLAGRYVAATLVTLAIIAVYYAIAVLGGTYFFGAAALPWHSLLISFGLAALYVVAAISAAFCVSAFIRSPVAGPVVTVLIFYVGFTTLEGVLELAGFEPWFSLNYGAGSIAAVLDTDFVHDLTVPVGSGQYSHVWAATPPEGAAIGLGYLLVFLTLSIILYQRKESTG